MNMGKALKIAFRPRKGTAIYLGIMAAMALVEFAIIEHQLFSRVVMFTLGSVLMALAVKLYAHVSFPLFLRCADHTLPRGSMFVLAVILHVSGGLLLLPLLWEHAQMSGV